MTRYHFHTIARALIIGLVCVVCIHPVQGLAQVSSSPFWSQQSTIPGYGDETLPPILIADQNGTVHSFASQLIGEDGSLVAITYNQWTIDNGWTDLNDVLLSPIKNEARLLDVFLDSQGVFHLLFFGGDETEGQILYAQAPIGQAHDARAWLGPVLVGEAAFDPQSGAIAGDDQGNLTIVYSGKLDGVGLYTLYSADWGETWTEPEPTFLTYSELFPFSLNLWSGRSGTIHMVWNIRNRGGNGRQINYAQLNLKKRQWSEQFRLAEADTGYGVVFPAVAEHNGEIIAVYSGITMRRSEDGGLTWTEPVEPFRLKGVNGEVSLVTDSSGVLHLFWGQRITGSPDIHGMWHSKWQGGDRWSDPQPVVSGPRINDESGNTGFDPYDARAVVSHGNVVLVTWRTDPGNAMKPNGVWYSFSRVDAPELPMAAVPTAIAVPTLSTSTDPTQTPLAPTPTSRPIPVRSGQESSAPTRVLPGHNPALPVAVAVVPTIFLVVLIISIMSPSVFQNRR